MHYLLLYYEDYKRESIDFGEILLKSDVNV